jgi:hypothetical protein
MAHFGIRRPKRSLNLAHFQYDSRLESHRAAKTSASKLPFRYGKIKVMALRGTAFRREPGSLFTVPRKRSAPKTVRS